MSEVRIEDEVRVDASPLEVWEAIKDPATHARWHPFVTEISGEHELGRVRTCAVIVGKKAGETKERCVEEEHASRITWAMEEDSTGFGRMVSGWRAGFALQQRDGATVVRAFSTFDAQQRARARDDLDHPTQVPSDATGDPRWGERIARGPTRQHRPRCRSRQEPLVVG